MQISHVLFCMLNFEIHQIQTWVLLFVFFFGLIGPACISKICSLWWCKCKWILTASVKMRWFLWSRAKHNIWLGFPLSFPQQGCFSFFCIQRMDSTSKHKRCPGYKWKTWLQDPWSYALGPDFPAKLMQC